jgi:outer membrane protein assembly factor BamB
MYGDKVVHAGDQGVKVFSAGSGELIWQGAGMHRMSVRHPPDLFVIDGLIWGGPMPQIAGCRGYPQLHKTPFAAPLVKGTAVKGLDVDTGKVARALDVGKLLSPGHHVRCYRSKATTRFLIWPKRGMEFVDIRQGQNHERVNWARGECGYGVMPSGGLLYVPPHPCICYVGVTLDGFNALAPARKRTLPAAPERPESRLEKGAAYGTPSRVPAGGAPARESWPMYRHDPARSGHTACAVPPRLRVGWTTRVGGKLAQPIVGGGRAYVVSIDAHTIHALRADSGKELWQYTADARVDSSPVLHGDLLLFGCTDGKVYCLRVSDGALVWRFRAAPEEARCVVREQVESRWPVHGSVLVQNGVAYVCAGRSSFLDGGLYLYGLDPETGKILHKAHSAGPWPDSRKGPSACYHMEGAKSDVLTGDGERVFLGFNEFDRGLNPVAGQPFSRDGSRPVRLHLMATTGFLDSSWFDRGRWTYSRRWPGRDYRHDTPYTGQILSFDTSTIYALRAFPSRGPMSPRFIPGRKGYSLVAYRCDPEVARQAKGSGPDAIKWQRHVPVRARGIVLAGDHLFLAGTPDAVPKDDPYAAFEGRMGALLWALSATDGKRLAEMKLTSPPVFDGISAAGGRLFVATTDGSVTCLTPEAE